MSHTSCRTRRIISLLTLTSVMASIEGCGPIKFYPGEERADSEVGRILFNTTGAELSMVTIDGISHAHPGRTVEVLPGPHRVQLKYQEHINETDTASLDPHKAETSLLRFGTCNVKFTIDAAQELFVYVDAGSSATLPGSTPPTVTLKEQGYDKPALFQERCKEEGTQSLNK